MYKNNSTFLLKTKINTSLDQIAIKQKFKIEDNRVLRASWQDDESKIDI